MFKWLFLFLLISPAAWAQTCPTRPPGDSTNACASTAFVNTKANGGSFTPNLPVIGGASGGLSQGTSSGTTTTFGTISGTLTSGHCVSINNGNLIDAGVTCNGSGGSGTITSGAANQVPYYSGAGTTIAGGTVLYAGSMACNGSTDDTAALQAVINASTGGYVIIPAGTCIISSTILMKANVTIDCSGSTITQLSSTNLSAFFNFSTNSANNAGIRHCIIDGNVANQTAAVCNGTMIQIGTANDVTVENNIIKNSMCIAVQITDGTSSSISRNHFSTNTYDNINITPTATQTPNHALIINNIVDNVGAHFVELVGSDYDTINGNVVNSGVLPAIHATVSGTSITWVSGPQFSTLHIGQFIICNGSAGYQELFIGKVNSATLLTTASTTTAGTNQVCIAGPGDLIDITGSFIEVGNNILNGSSTGGIVPNNFPVAETVQQLKIHDNNMSNTGEGCIDIETISNAGTQIFDNSYTGNHCDTPCLGESANAFQAGIFIASIAGGSIQSQWFDGNFITDTTSNTSYWMGVEGPSTQMANVGYNTSRTMTANGIFGGITSTPNSGWGSGATVTNVITNGSSYQLVITAGTSPVTNPNIQVVKAVSGAVTTPVTPTCSVSTSTGVSAIMGVSGATITQDNLVLQGTPTSGTIYTIRCLE